MHFLRPEFLWLLLCLPLIYWLQYTRQRSIGSWSQLIAKELQPFMLSKGQQTDRFSKWYSPLLMFVVLLLILALSGPSWKKHESAIYDAQGGLVIALDLSLSMTAQDVSPSRLQRAKFKIIDVLNQYPDMNTALMAYAGDAHVATPLTKDNETIKAMLSALDPYIMPEPGSNVIRLVEQAIQLFEQGQTQSRRLLLVTDGVEKRDITQAAQMLADANIDMSILAIGTQEGAPIVRPDGQFFKDAQGQVIMPGLEWTDLQSFAEQANGKITQLKSNDSDIRYLINTDMNSAIKKADSNIVFDQWADNGVWFLWLALPFILLLFRKGIILSTVLIISMASHNEVWASPYENTPSWLLNDDQHARQVFESDPKKAAELFDDTRWQASSYYKAGQYEKALELWQNFDDTNSLYNQGNALAKLNRFDEAINAYETALEQSPNHEKAAFNKALLEKLKQQQEQQSSQDQQSDSQQNNSQNQDSQQGQQGDQQQDSESNNNSQQNDQGSQNGSQQEFDDKAASENPNQPSDQQQQMDQQQEQAEPKAQNNEQTSELQKQDSEPQATPQQSAAQTRQQSEQEQAMQQWMERIPDDPGGLLRNKFLYQYKNRNRDESNGDRKPW